MARLRNIDSSFYNLQPASWLIKYKNILLGGVQQEVGAEAEDLVMVQTPLSSLRLNNDVLAHKVKEKLR